MYMIKIFLFTFPSIATSFIYTNFYITKKSFIHHYMHKFCM